MDAPFVEALSRAALVTCSVSVTTLFVACCIECEEDGRRAAGVSCSLTDVTEAAVEFLRARADNGRSAAPAAALLMAKLAARGDEAVGGEWGGIGFLRWAGAGAARGLRLAALFSGAGVLRGLDPPRTPLLATLRALLVDRSMGGAVGAAAARAFSVFFRLP